MSNTPPHLDYVLSYPADTWSAKLSPLPCKSWTDAQKADLLAWARQFGGLSIRHGGIYILMPDGDKSNWPTIPCPRQIKQRTKSLEAATERAKLRDNMDAEDCASLQTLPYGKWAIAQIPNAPAIAQVSLAKLASGNGTRGDQLTLGTHCRDWLSANNIQTPGDIVDMAK